MTTSESEPPESGIAPPIVLDTRKAKVVALFAAAPSAAVLFFWLYHAARRFDLLPGTSLRPADAAGWAFGSAVFLAFAVIPLYFAIKIWRRPTLNNLRRVPFLAAFSCYLGVFAIFPFLFPFFGISFKDTEPELLDQVGWLFSSFLMLGVYFLVKKAMVLWFKTPELAQSGLQTGSRRVLWGLYCFGVWGVLWNIGDDISSALGYDDDFLWIDSTGWFLIALLISIVIAVYVYKIGLRPLGLEYNKW